MKCLALRTSQNYLTNRTFTTSTISATFWYPSTYSIPLVTSNSLCRSMCNNFCPSTAMPYCKQSPTVSTLMLDVLEPSREVGNTTTAETEAAKQCHKTISFNQISDFLVDKQIETYCVVPPETNSTLVICLCLHAGQSTGAGPCCNACKGVALAKLV